jgi:predicted RNase H-like HicB family nuclease
MMEIKQRDFQVLEALFRSGGRATPGAIHVSLNGRAGGTLASLRNRLRRLALRGYVVRNGPEYDLTFIGQESFLEELGWREPESPLLMDARRRKSYVLSAEIEALPEGGYLASCPDIQGCHAEGATVADALANLEDGARALLSLHYGKHLDEFVDGEYEPGRRLKAELVVSLAA